MEIEIKATKVDLTKREKDYIKDKISSCKKFLNNRLDVPVNIEVEKVTHHRKGKVYRAEVNLSLPKKFLRIESTERNLQLLVTDLKDKLQRHLKKYKDKKTSKLKRRI
jgi:ribosomal subunit interface protein